MKKQWFFFLFLVFTLFPIVSNAAVVYDNGPSLWDGAASFRGMVRADDFILTNDASVYGASLDLWFYSDTDTSDFDGMNWWFFDNDNGLPGDIISQGTGQNYALDFIGSHQNTEVSFWKCYFDLGEDISLNANNTYWFGLTLTDPTDAVLWSDTLASGYNDARSIGGTFDNWVQNSNPERNHAFALEGNQVPIPGAIWLLASGIVGLAGLRKRFHQ